MTRGIRGRGIGIGLVLVLGTAGVGQAAKAPVACRHGDPIVGVWRARQWVGAYRDWHDFTLRIERVPGSPDRVRGTIVAELWHGGSDDGRPGDCSAVGGTHYRVVMRASGTFVDGRLDFGAYEGFIARDWCGGADIDDYNLDRFVGRLQGVVLRAEDHDGNRDHDPAVDFRREPCKAAPPTPSGPGPDVS